LFSVKLFLLRKLTLITIVGLKNGAGISNEGTNISKTQHLKVGKGVADAKQLLKVSCLQEFWG